jgi:hypothetical protein
LSWNGSGSTSSTQWEEGGSCTAWSRLMLAWQQQLSLLLLLLLLLVVVHPVWMFMLLLLLQAAFNHMICIRGEQQQHCEGAP